MQDYDQPIVPKPPKKPSNSADQQQTQPSFFFPNFIYRGLKFKSPEEIRKKTYISDPKHKSIWKFRYRPRKSNCEYFTVVCKFCDANFNTKRKQDGYVVISVKLKHNHRPPAHYQFFEKISNILIQGELEENSEKQQIFRSEESLQQQNPQSPKHPNLQQQLPQLPQPPSIQSSSSSLKQPQFIFPATIKVNDTFDCFEDIMKKIQYEEKTIGENFKSGWWYRFRPRKLDYTYLVVICRQCDAHFCLTRKRGAFLTVSNVRLKHNHQLKGYKQGVECKEARVFDFLKERYKSLNISGKKLKKQLQKQIKIDDANFNKIKSQFLKLQANKWPYLQNFLSQTKSKSLSDWLSLNPQTQRYPPITVIVSPSMSQTYQKFGDLLIFDILQNMLTSFSQDCSYRKIGIFSVIDTNLRPLIAGIAIFQHQNDLLLLKTFKMFLEIHQKTPETIMTDDNPTINAAMAELKAIYVTSLGHVLNPRLVIGRVGKALKGEVREVEKSLRVLCEVMESRTLEGYERKLTELVRDEGVGEQIESILAIKEKIFYMEMPKTFVGINLTTMEGVCDMIRQSIQPKSTIIELTKQLHNLSQRLYLHLKKKNCQSYHDPIQRSLEDWRVRHVRLSFQRKPFTHFLSNYIKGLKTLILNDTCNPNPNTLQLLNLTTGESFDIVDWTCECGQQEKTGIPCSHLIMAAKTVPDKSYRELFYRRWKKGVVRQRERWAIMGRPRETMRRRSRGWNKGVTQDGRGADDEGDQ